MSTTTAPRFRRRVKAIAQYLNEDERCTFRMLERGAIAGAKKEGHFWTLDTLVYEQSFRGVEAAA